MGKWVQHENGMQTYDGTSEIHDVRMRVDCLYRAEHIDKVERYKEIPWHLRTRNKPLIYAGIAAIAWATGMAALATSLPPENPGNSPAQTEIKK